MRWRRAGSYSPQLRALAIGLARCPPAQRRVRARLVVEVDPRPDDPSGLRSAMVGERRATAAWFENEVGQRNGADLGGSCNRLSMYALDAKSCVVKTIRRLVPVSYAGRGPSGAAVLGRDPGIEDLVGGSSRSCHAPDGSRPCRRSEASRPGEPASPVHSSLPLCRPLGRRGCHGVSSRVDQTLKKLLGCTSPWVHGDISCQVSCLARLHVVSFSIDENMITVEVMKRLGKLGTAFVREPERHPNRGWVAASGPHGGSSDGRRDPPRPPPRTGEPVEVPARAVAAFKPSRHLSNQVARRHSPAVAERPAGGPVEAS